MEVESKLGFLAIFNLDLTVKNFKVEISTGKPVTPLQTRSDSDTIFSLVQVFVFSLASNFQFPGNRRSV